jgi:hypothetical protein
MANETLPDDPAIAGTLRLLYEVISFEEDGEPNWDGLEQVFSRHARITRITPESTDYLDRESFLAMTRNLVEIGAYTSFFELEVARVVERFGDMAHVWSMYETRRSKEAREALGRGVNSIQLVREGDAWRVVALLWDETHADPRLEVKSVFPKGENRGEN